LKDFMIRMLKSDTSLRGATETAHPYQKYTFLKDIML